MQPPTAPEAHLLARGCRLSCSLWAREEEEEEEEGGGRRSALAAYVPKRGCGGVLVPAPKGGAISPPISLPCDPPGMGTSFAWRRRSSSIRRRWRQQ